VDWTAKPRKENDEEKSFIFILTFKSQPAKKSSLFLCSIWVIMVLMTMVARVADGLPLAASIQEDEQVSFQPQKRLTRECSLQLGKNVVDYQNQAKRLFRTLTPTSPIKCAIESGPYLFQ